jgi:hypothetical protein
MAKEWIVPDADLGCDGAYFDYQELVRCRDCIHWKPPHILQNDGTEREYNPETDTDNLGLLLVSVDVGINVGGKCYVDHNTGYSEDKTVFRTEDNYCGKAIRGGNIPLNGERKDGAE